MCYEIPGNLINVFVVTDIIIFVKARKYSIPLIVAKRGINVMQQPRNTSSVENQKGVNIIEQYSVKNQKGAIAIYFVKR